MRLVLVDGNAILHRAYHALPPLTSKSGQLVNAVYGFFTMLMRVVDDLKPTHLAVTFDTEKPTFRHAAFVGYQAQRPRMESDLASQISIVQEVLTSAGIPLYIAPGYEADDVIGTLVKQATQLSVIGGQLSDTSQSVVGLPVKQKNRKPVNQNLKTENREPITEVIIVSGDRDLLQLVGEQVKVYVPMKGLSEAHLFGNGEVKKYLGVTPAQVVDYKALVGDQSDNYPGVSGIGPKTAVMLLEKFKTLDSIYKNLKKIEPSLVQKLSQDYQSAVLSRELAQISTTAPVELDLDKMEFTGFIGNQKLISKMAELGFKSLVASLTGKEVIKKAKQVKNQLKLV